MVIQAHSKMTFEGIFGTVAAPAEIWSFSVKFGVIGVGPPADLTEVTANAAAGAAAWATHIAPLHHGRVRLQRVLFSRHDEGGLTQTMPDGSYVQGEALVDTPGTSGWTTNFPLQIATCVSLVTPRPGPSGRGRFFLPQTVQGLNDAFVMGNTGSGTVANAAKDLLNALEAVTGEVRVFSAKGFSTAVTHVRVGGVMDTMRSRRNAQEEVYVSVAL